MEAVVLAGGFGTRLQSVVADVPKPMAPVNEKPFLEYLLKYLKRNKINKVILSVGYKWEVIKEYFGNSFDGIELEYSIENEPLGTGGAIKLALEKANNKEVFIINGDTFFNIDLSSLKLENKSKGQLSLKTLYNFDRYGCVETGDNNNIISFKEKEFRTQGNINGGIYLVKSDIFNGFELESKFSFENFIENNLYELALTSKTFSNYFIDIGIPTDYEKAQSELKDFL